MTYTRDSFQQLSETYSSIVEKKVTYYKGNDRDKQTGIPKGVKSQSSPKQPKEKKQTKPPYESLAASHELQGDVIEAKDEKGLSPEAKKELRNTRSPHLSKIAHTTTDKYKGVYSLSNKRQDVHRKMDGIKKPKAESPRMTKAKKALSSVAPKDDWAESKQDDTYLEPNWEKRKKNNEKARKEMQKDAKDSGYTDIALKASLSKGAGRISEAVKMSKKAWKKTHPDFRNDDEKSPRVLKLNPKTQGTESHPVTFTKEDSEYGYDKDGKSLNPKDKKKEKLPDMRELPTRMNLVKNKLRAMGLKMSQQLTGDQLLEVARYSIKEGDYHSGQGEKIQKRTKKWMEKKGQEGAPGLDAMKARTAEHEAKRGVKEEVNTPPGRTKTSKQDDDIAVSRNKSQSPRKDEKVTVYKASPKDLKKDPTGGIASKREKDLGKTKTISKKRRSARTEYLDDRSNERYVDTQSQYSRKSSSTDVNEATRLKKEQGYQKGGTKKPSGKKDAALSYVLDKIKKEGGVVIGQGSRQQKKVKGAKSDAGTGKYKRAADEKKQTAADAKEMGYGDNVKGYIETRARYGSKENMKSGRGLGT